MIEDGLDAGVDVGFQLAVLRFEVDELHLFIFAHFRPRRDTPPSICTGIFYFQLFTAALPRGDRLFSMI